MFMAELLLEVKSSKLLQGKIVAIADNSERLLDLYRTAPLLKSLV